jgi:DNA polymerase III alpha subunit
MWTNNIEDLVTGVISYGPEILSNCIVDSAILDQYKNTLLAEKLSYPLPREEIRSRDWYIPEKYKNIDILQYCLDKCSNDAEISRIKLEYELYVKYQMVDVLRSMIYLVDTFKANELVWGVGRGSSTASFMLYIIGIHKINSIKYDLPIQEFFKGE